MFGSGLAIVPFLYGGVVTEHHWLTVRQFMEVVADLSTIIFAVGTALLLWRFKKLQEPVIVVGAALISLVIYPLMH